MGKLQDSIRAAQVVARKQQDKELLSAYNIILGEIARLKGSKDPWTHKLQTSDIEDNIILHVLKKMHTQEWDLVRAGGDPPSVLLKVLDTLVPKAVPEMEIILWIGRNVDFAKLKSPNQAIGMVKKHFGQAADGNTVKRIVEDLAI